MQCEGMFDIGILHPGSGQLPVAAESVTRMKIREAAKGSQVVLWKEPPGEPVYSVLICTELSAAFPR